MHRRKCIKTSSSFSLVLIKLVGVGISENAVGRKNNLMYSLYPRIHILRTTRAGIRVSLTVAMLCPPEGELEGDADVLTCDEETGLPVSDIFRCNCVLCFMVLKFLNLF